MAYTQIGTARSWVGSISKGGVQYGLEGNNLISITDAGVETIIGAVGSGWGTIQTDGTFVYTNTGTTIHKSYNNGVGTYLSLNCGYPVRAMAIDTANSRLYYALSDGSIYYTSTTTFSGNFFVAAGIGDSFCCSMTVLKGYLYFAKYNGQIYKINLTTKAITVLSKTITLPYLVLTNDGTNLYATVDGGYIYWIDTNDVLQYKQILGDSQGRWWYGLNYNSTKNALYGNVYQGYTYKIDIPVPAAPTASTATSSFDYPISISLSCSTSGAVIRYTVDGSTPSDTNGSVYSTAITISTTTTLKICSINNGFVTQGPTYTYTNTPPAPMKTILGDSGTWYSTYYYNGFIYAGNATALYKIDILTNAKTLLYTWGSIIYNVYVDGSFIYVANGGTVRQLNMSGTLIASGSIGPTYSMVSSFVSYGGTLYAFLYNILSSKYYYQIGVFGSNLYGTAIDCDIYSHYDGAVNINNVIYVIKYMSDLSFNVYTVNPSNTTASLIGTTNSVTRISPSTAIICQATTDGTNIYVAVTGGGIYSINLSTFNLQILTNFKATSVRGLTYNPVHNSLIAGMQGNGIYEFAMVIGKSSSSIYSGGVWKNPNTKYVYTSGAWKPATKIFEIKNGVWLQVF